MILFYLFVQKYDMTLESANPKEDVKLIKGWQCRDFHFNVLFKKNV